MILDQGDVGVGSHMWSLKSFFFPNIFFPINRCSFGSGRVSMETTGALAKYIWGCNNCEGSRTVR